MGFTWVLLGFNGLYWVLLRFVTEFYWVLLGFTGFIGFYWVLLGFTGFYWVLLGFTRIARACCACYSLSVEGSIKNSVKPSKYGQVD